MRKVLDLGLNLRQKPQALDGRALGTGGGKKNAEAEKKFLTAQLVLGILTIRAEEKVLVDSLESPN